MHQTRGRGRYEPKYEDYRGSPYGQQYDRPRDTSPQRQMYDRSIDPRGNPHSDVYDPKFNPASPLPSYHNFPQPQYKRNHEGGFVSSCCGPAYQEADPGPNDRHSPFRQLYERPRDPSPQRNAYDRSIDQRGNPPKDVYIPEFNTTSPILTRHNSPQPRYKQNYEGGCGYHRREPVQGQRHYQGVDAFQEKPFDYRYSNRYHQMPDERRKPKVEDLPWQPAGAPHMQYRRDDDMPTGQYDTVKPAGRANKYNTRITDLLTSIKDPEKKDESLNRLMQANKGYLVMVRFRPSDLADVITAVQESVSTLTAHDGYCIGFSEPRLMHIVLPSHQSMASDRWWDARDDRQSRHAVACFWFKDYIHARDWFQTGSVRFKQPEFPNNSPYQVVAIPLTYGRNKDPIPFTPDKDEITLLWSEYPSIFERYEHDFFDHYSRPENHIMRRYGGNPYVSACKYKAGDITPLNKFGSPGYARFEVPVERVARSWRGSWIAPDTVITVSTFPSMRDVSEFFYDPDYSEIRKNLSRYTEPVIVAITLKKVQGTSRR